MTDRERDTLALAGVPRVGARTHARLVTLFGDPGHVFRASQRELMDVEGIGETTATAILTFDRDRFVGAQERLMEDAGAVMLTRDDPRYPQALNRFTSAPPVLFVRGDAEVLARMSAAVVGTRRPSGYGLRMTRLIGEGLARAGWCVTSGMAAGVDAAAHRAVLDAGGCTVAVFGCGVDVIYPHRNRTLAGAIAAQGCLVSQFPMGTPGAPGNFPARNAVVVGLSLGTVVVEAPEGSGALITAALTLRAGRHLFAVPGNADSPQSAGSNRLFAQGAIPVSGPEDICAVLGGASPDEAGRECACKPERPRPAGFSGTVLDILVSGPLHVDAIAGRLGVSIRETLSVLTELEMDRHVIQRPGMVFERR